MPWAVAAAGKQPDAQRRCRRGQAANPGTGRTPIVPLFGLAPGGVWPPVCRHTRPGALTARFHPCRRRDRYGRLGRRYVSVPLSVAGARRCRRPPTPGDYPAPCPVEPGLSSPKRCAAPQRRQRPVPRRPPGRPGVLPAGNANIKCGCGSTAVARLKLRQAD